MYLTLETLCLNLFYTDTIIFMKEQSFVFLCKADALLVVSFVELESGLLGT